MVAPPSSKQQAVNKANQAKAKTSTPTTKPSGSGADKAKPSNSSTKNTPAKSSTTMAAAAAKKTTPSGAGINTKPKSSTTMAAAGADKSPVARLAQGLTPKNTTIVKKTSETSAADRPGNSFAQVDLRNPSTIRQPSSRPAISSIVAGDNKVNYGNIVSEQEIGSLLRPTPVFKNGKLTKGPDYGGIMLAKADQLGVPQSTKSLKTSLPVDPSKKGYGESVIAALVKGRNSEPTPGPVATVKTSPKEKYDPLTSVKTPLPVSETNWAAKTALQVPIKSLKDAWQPGFLDVPPDEWPGITKVAKTSTQQSPVFTQAAQTPTYQNPGRAFPTRQVAKSVGFDQLPEVADPTRIGQRMNTFPTWNPVAASVDVEPTVGQTASSLVSQPKGFSEAMFPKFDPAKIIPDKKVETAQVKKETPKPIPVLDLRPSKLLADGYGAYQQPPGAPAPAARPPAFVQNLLDKGFTGGTPPAPAPVAADPNNPWAGWYGTGNFAAKKTELLNALEDARMKAGKASETPATPTQSPMAGQGSAWPIQGQETMFDFEIGSPQDEFFQNWAKSLEPSTVKARKNFQPGNASGGASIYDANLPDVPAPIDWAFHKADNAGKAVTKFAKPLTDTFSKWDMALGGDGVGSFDPTNVRNGSSNRDTPQANKPPQVAPAAGMEWFWTGSTWSQRPISGGGGGIGGGSGSGTTTPPPYTRGGFDVVYGPGLDPDSWYRRERARLQAELEAMGIPF